MIDIERSAWAGKVSRSLRSVAQHPYLEVHHSGGSAHYNQAITQVAAAIERDHLSRGWQGIFYTLLIATDGKVCEGRGIGFRSIGSYEPLYSDRTPVSPDALTVLLPGDYGSQRPTAAQLATLDRLRTLVPDPRLRWHNMRAATACPGAHAVSELRTLNTQTPQQTDDDMTIFVQDRASQWWACNGAWRHAVTAETVNKWAFITGGKIERHAAGDFADLCLLGSAPTSSASGSGLTQAQLEATLKRQRITL